MKNKIMGIIGILSPILPIPLWIMALINAPWFSWTGNAISDMGKYPRSSAIYLNSGLILMGAMFLIFSSFLLLYFESKLKKTGAFIMVLYSVFLVCIGVFSENYEPFHYYFSILFFSLLGLSFIPFALSCFAYGEYSKYTYSFIYSIFGFIIIVALWTIRWKEITGGVAIPEFISGLMGILWIEILSYHVFHGDFL